MAKYEFVAVVDRAVQDRIILTVEAESELHAYSVAEKVLDIFPSPHKEDGVSYCYVEERRYSEPFLVSINEREDLGVG